MASYKRGILKSHSHIHVYHNLNVYPTQFNNLSNERELQSSTHSNSNGQLINAIRVGTETVIHWIAVVEIQAFYCLKYVRTQEASLMYLLMLDGIDDDWNVGKAFQYHWRQIDYELIGPIYFVINAVPALPSSINWLKLILICERPHSQ